VHALLEEQLEQPVAVGNPCCFDFQRLRHASLSKFGSEIGEYCTSKRETHFFRIPKAWWSTLTRVDAVRRYLLLGLRLGRHVDGLVDAYYGPPDLREQADSEPVPEPTALVDEADDLLGRLDDGWLRDQVRGLRTYAGVLAGEALSYSDEVDGC